MGGAEVTSLTDALDGFLDEIGTGDPAVGRFTEVPRKQATIGQALDAQLSHDLDIAESLLDSPSHRGNKVRLDAESGFHKELIDAEI